MVGGAVDEIVEVQFAGLGEQLLVALADPAEDVRGMPGCEPRPPRERARDCSISRSALLVFTWSRNVASNPDSNEILVSERSASSSWRGIGTRTTPLASSFSCNDERQMPRLCSQLNVSIRAVPNRS